jgi:hypothetical protein
MIHVAGVFARDLGPDHLIGFTPLDLSYDEKGALVELHAPRLDPLKAILAKRRRRDRSRRCAESRARAAEPAMVPQMRSDGRRRHRHCIAA